MQELPVSKVQFVEKRHRCVGMTTAIAAFLLWRAIKQHRTTSLCFASRHHEADNSRQRVRDLIDLFEADFLTAPGGLRFRDMRGEIQLINNSRMLFLSNENQLRGISLDFAVLEGETREEFNNVLVHLTSSARALCVHNRGIPSQLVTTSTDYLFKTHDY